MIVYNSHDMDEITTLFDRIYSMGKDPFYKELLRGKGLFVEVL